MGGICVEESDIQESKHKAFAENKQNGMSKPLWRWQGCIDKVQKI